MHIMLQILDTLLASLARLMVARGIAFPDLAERLKAHYVAAATRAGAKTDSRISVVTGLQRRDIARLRAEPPRQERPNHLATLIARWQTDPAYQSRPLPKSGPAPSFEALAHSILRDVHPRTMLDALHAAGTIAVDQDQITLQHRSYQPLAGSEDQLSYLAHNLADHVSAATDNVTGHTPPHFERAVHYDGLTEAQTQKLATYHHTRQMALFEELSQQAAAMKALHADAATHRFRAGAYFYPARSDQQDDAQ